MSISSLCNCPKDSEHMMDAETLKRPPCIRILAFLDIKHRHVNAFQDSSPGCQSSFCLTSKSLSFGVIIELISKPIKRKKR